MILKIFYHFLKTFSFTLLCFLDAAAAETCIIFKNSLRHFLTILCAAVCFPTYTNCKIMKIELNSILNIQFKSKQNRASNQKSEIKLDFSKIQSNINILWLSLFVIVSMILFKHKHDSCNKQALRTRSFVLRIFFRYTISYVAGRQLVGSWLVAVRQLLDSCWVAVRQLLGSCQQAVNKQLASSQQAVSKLLVSNFLTCPRQTTTTTFGHIELLSAAKKQLIVTLRWPKNTLR